MKERLTGAIILVVLVVALVPELLSGPKPAPPPKLVTTEDGAPIRSVTIDLGEPTAPVSSPTAAASPVAAEATADAAPASLPKPPVLAAQSAAATAAHASPPPPRSPSPALPPTPTPSLPSPSAAPPSAPPTPAPVVNGESFVVQAGTFSSRANATRLAQQLSDKGLSAHVAPFKSGRTELYRVRVGPAGDRTAVLSVLAKVKAAGSAGTVVPNLSQATVSP